MAKHPKKKPLKKRATQLSAAQLPVPHVLSRPSILHERPASVSALEESAKLVRRDMFRILLTLGAVAAVLAAITAADRVGGKIGEAGRMVSRAANL